MCGHSFPAGCRPPSYLFFTGPQMHANSREDVKEARAGDIVAIAGLKVRLRWTAGYIWVGLRWQACCGQVLGLGTVSGFVAAHAEAAAFVRASLQDVVTGDTLCDEKAPVLLERMEFPDPVIKVRLLAAVLICPVGNAQQLQGHAGARHNTLGAHRPEPQSSAATLCFHLACKLKSAALPPLHQVAIEPKTKGDLDKMTNGLIKLAQEDPSFHFRWAARLLKHGR